MRETMNVKDAQLRLEQLKNGKIPPRETPALANPMYAKAYDGFLKYGSACDTLREGSDGAGGFLVPDEFEEKIVTALKEGNVLRQLATVRTTKHPLKLTKAVGEGHAVWVPEEGAIPEQSSSFEQLQLGAYKLATMVRVTDELLEDSALTSRTSLQRPSANAWRTRRRRHSCSATAGANLWASQVRWKCASLRKMKLKSRRMICWSCSTAFPRNTATTACI